MSETELGVFVGIGMAMVIFLSFVPVVVVWVLCTRKIERIKALRDAAVSDEPRHAPGAATDCLVAGCRWGDPDDARCECSDAPLGEPAPLTRANWLPKVTLMPPPGWTMSTESSLRTDRRRTMSTVVYMQGVATGTNADAPRVWAVEVERLRADVESERQVAQDYHAEILAAHAEIERLTGERDNLQTTVDHDHAYIRKVEAQLGDLRDRGNALLCKWQTFREPSVGMLFDEHDRPYLTIDYATTRLGEALSGTERYSIQPCDCDASACRRHNPEASEHA